MRISKLNILATVAACAIPLMAGATVLFVLANREDRSSMDGQMSAVYRPQLPEEMHLYKGDIDAQTGKPMVLADRGKLFGTTDNTGRLTVTDEMVKLKDGGLKLTKLVPEAVGTTDHHKISSREYFPHQGDEEFWRLHDESLFNADGVTLKQQQVFHATGTPELEGFRHDDGSWDLTTYFDDGETVKLKRLTPPNADTADPVREEQFRNKEEGNYLLSSNFLNPNGTRTLTEYSTRKNYPWKITQTGDYGDHVIGTTIRAWYPTTSNLRLDAEVTAYGTKAEFYRENGSLFRKLQLRLFSHEDIFYGDDGKSPTLEQWWERKVSIENHKKKVVEILVKLVEYSGGNATRVFWFDPTGRIKSIVRLNVVEGGVRYPKIESFYRSDPSDGTEAEMGTLRAVGYTRSDSKDGKPTFKELTAAQNIRPDIPQNEIGQPDMSDDLPVPAPSRMAPA